MSARHLGLSGQDDRDADTPTTPTTLPATVTGYPVGTRHPEGTVTITGDPVCGHLPGELHDEACDYWRGVAAGEYEPPSSVVHLPPFPLRELRERGITAADIDRGAA